MTVEEFQVEVLQFFPTLKWQFRQAGEDLFAESEWTVGFSVQGRATTVFRHEQVKWAVTVLTQEYDPRGSGYLVTGTLHGEGTTLRLAWLDFNTTKTRMDGFLLPLGV
jgi:hypothetical protein